MQVQDYDSRKLHVRNLLLSLLALFVAFLTVVLDVHWLQDIRKRTLNVFSALNSESHKRIIGHTLTALGTRYYCLLHSCENVVDY